MKTIDDAKEALREIDAKFPDLIRAHVIGVAVSVAMEVNYPLDFKTGRFQKYDAWGQVVGSNRVWASLTFEADRNEVREKTDWRSAIQ